MIRIPRMLLIMRKIQKIHMTVQTIRKIRIRKHMIIRQMKQEQQKRPMRMYMVRMNSHPEVQKFPTENRMRTHTTIRVKPPMKIQMIMHMKIQRKLLMKTRMEITANRIQKQLMIRQYRHLVRQRLIRRQQRPHKRMRQVQSRQIAIPQKLQMTMLYWLHM